jgi:hypothetical protein
MPFETQKTGLAAVESRRTASDAWMRIANALSASTDGGDKTLGNAIREQFGMERERPRATGVNPSRRSASRNVEPRR